MGFITVRKVKRYNGLEVYGAPPPTPVYQRVGSALKTGITKTKTVVQTTSNEINKAKSSAGFKSFQGWLSNTNQYYNQGFDADREHISAQRKRRWMSLTVPSYAKRAASEGLAERRRNGAGLTPLQAREQGIASGVNRAYQLQRQERINIATVRRVAAFYQRFKHQDTPRAETAIKLWGGRRFGQTAVRYLKNRSSRSWPWCFPKNSLSEATCIFSCGSSHNIFNFLYGLLVMITPEDFSLYKSFPSMFTFTNDFFVITVSYDVSYNCKSDKHYGHFECIERYITYPHINSLIICLFYPIRCTVGSAATVACQDLPSSSIQASISSVSPQCLLESTPSHTS